MKSENDTLWQARALAQKMPGGDELDKLLVFFQVEREKVRAILDAQLTGRTDDMTFIDLAEVVSERIDNLDRENARLLDTLEELETGMKADDGYYAFATQLGWQYPDGEPMPTWAQLDFETQNAFIAFAKAIWNH
jgi:hypothetical protein